MLQKADAEERKVDCADAAAAECGERSPRDVGGGGNGNGRGNATAEACNEAGELEHDVDAISCALDLDNSADITLPEFLWFMLSYEHFVRECGLAAAAAAPKTPTTLAAPTTLALARPPRGAGARDEPLGRDVPRDWALAGTAAAYADTTAGSDDRTGEEEERGSDERARGALVREWRALKRDAKRVEARRAAIERHFASLEGGDGRGSGARGASGPDPPQSQRARPPWRCAVTTAACGPRPPAPEAMATATNGARGGARGAGDDDDDDDGPFALLLEEQPFVAHGGGRDPPPSPREFEVVGSDDDAAPNGASSLGCGACAALGALP